jgi:hypothetical protein
MAAVVENRSLFLPLCVISGLSEIESGVFKQDYRPRDLASFEAMVQF